MFRAKLVVSFVRPSRCSIKSRAPRPALTRVASIPPGRGPSPGTLQVAWDKCSVAFSSVSPGYPWPRWLRTTPGHPVPLKDYRLSLDHSIQGDVHDVVAGALLWPHAVLPRLGAPERPNRCLAPDKMAGFTGVIHPRSSTPTSYLSSIDRALLLRTKCEWSK